MTDVKTRVFAFVLVAVAAAMLADLSAKPRSKYTAENFARLEVGMMMEDAVAILGEPGSVDETMQDMAWVMWYSPFDANSSITGIFAYPSGELKSISQRGELPDRPLLMPEFRHKRKKPTFVRKLIAYNQEQERRKTLMLDPPRPASSGPVLP